MKTFDDLEFKPHECGCGEHAIMYFDNGYGVSIVTGGLFYTTSAKPYELAVLIKGQGLTYDTPVTSDVEGYLTESKVTELMKQVQELPKVEISSGA